MKIFSTFLLVYVIACLLFLSGCTTLETSNIEPRKINKNIIEQNISEQIVTGTDYERKIHKDKIIVDVVENNQIEPKIEPKFEPKFEPKIEPKSANIKYIKKNRLIETSEKEIKLNEIILIEKISSKIISNTEIIEEEKIINVSEDKKDFIIVDKANEIVDNLIETDKKNDSKSESINSLLDSLILSEKGIAEKTENIKNKVIKNKKVPVNPDQIMDNLIITETTRENANQIIEVLISSDSLNKKN